MLVLIKTSNCIAEYEGRDEGRAVVSAMKAMLIQEGMRDEALLSTKSTTKGRKEMLSLNASCFERLN